MENCYGIQKIQQDIDFSKNNVAVIYAPNGTMKSSFAKTFEAIRDKGEIFELTGTGYSKADWLKAGMGIDTSKDPLDELKEFED